MNSRRLLIALLAALLLSGIVTFFLNRKISRRMVTAPAQQTQKWVAASRPLRAGEVLQAESLTLVDWPAKLPLEGAFTKTEDLVGRVVVYPVAARQPVLGGYLAPLGSGTGLAVRIPEGMRAASVRSDEVVGVAGFLYPGSHVDVLVTLRGEGPLSSATQIVLQDVDVLTVDQKTDPEAGGKAEKAGVVTLLLKPEDAQKLVLASTQGSIHFILRNGADHGTVTAVPVRIAELSAGAHAPGPARVRVPSATQHSYEVETIMGDKHATSQFD
jgi:pilus assembly protein CpaB